ncbi:MAG TPA: outer membrane lipoprotein carrier protein LolA [Terriglobales bacterium]|nr:outer membrane lipoprotein carrier protein LolA [Terriglobales bacterium]
MKKILLILALGVALVSIAAPQALAIGQLVETLDGRYNSIRSWQADFTQTFTSGLETRTESGHLYLQKPGRMRWDYTDPVKKTFLVAGKNIWQYTAGEPTATLTTVKDSNDLRTPLRFLLGHTELNKELEGLSYSGLAPWRQGDVVIYGKPHAAEAAGWREVWIEVTPAYEIDRLVIGGLDGSQNDIRLSRIQVNAKLPKELFQFRPPAGVRVVPGD